VDLQSDQIERAIEAVCGADLVAYVRATALATTLAGDAIAANLLMLGFAYQRGLLPVGLASIERAIELNAVAVQANKKIFAWGRLAAHDPARLASLSGAMTLSQLMARHEQELEAYQNRAYAARYRGLVDRVSAAEQAIAPDSDALTEAVARNLFKLMAYKDEYEVARLFANGRFMDQLKREFEGDIRLEFHLAIPLLSDLFGAKGAPRKRRYGGWMLRAFGLLTYGKALRGTPLDPFGYSEERRFERALLADYVALVESMLDGLTPDTLGLAVKLAKVPERIRGFGHIKRQAALEAKNMTSEMLGAFRAAGVAA
jgi:indolepyruvate ferredoxin oxidoreductase